MKHFSNEEYSWPPYEKYLQYFNTPLPVELYEDFIRDFTPSWQRFHESMAHLDPDPLWKHGAPEFTPSYGQPQPSIGISTHKGPARGLVIVCPGGAFLCKADYEGVPVAERFFNEGLNTAVLDYRVKPYEWDISLADAQRAIRYVRKNAERLNTLPDKIAVLGFSAGGILSARAGTIFNGGDPSSEDPVEQISSRPDAVVICYGSMSQAAFPAAVLGYDRSKQQENVPLSPDAMMHVGCPPFFIWQCAGEDDPRCALNLANRLTIFGIPFELHIFPHGVHGTALSDGGSPNPNSNDPHVAHWVELCVEWLKNLEFK